MARHDDAHHGRTDVRARAHRAVLRGCTHSRQLRWSLALVRPASRERHARPRRLLRLVSALLVQVAGRRRVVARRRRHAVRRRRGRRRAAARRVRRRRRRLRVVRVVLLLVRRRRVAVHLRRRRLLALELLELDTHTRIADFFSLMKHQFRRENGDALRKFEVIYKGTGEHEYCGARWHAPARPRFCAADLCKSVGNSRTQFLL